MSAPAENPVVIYTDGACKNNPGRGGWGVVLSRNGRSRELFGGEPMTTDNRMKLTAAIRGLEALKKPLPVQLITDFRIIVQGMTEWIEGWKARGWKKANGKPVENADLWQRLDQLAAVHQVEWVWVRGHTGHAWSERADQLANMGVPKGTQ